MVFVFRPLVVWGGALKLDFPTRGEKHFNIGYDATWGDDKDGENDGSPQPWRSVLLSLGQGELSSRLQMRNLPDQT